MDDTVSKFCDGTHLEYIQYTFSIVFFVITIIPFMFGLKWFLLNRGKVLKMFSVSYLCIGLLYISFVISSALAVYSCHHISNDAQRMFRMIGMASYVCQITFLFFTIIGRLRLSFDNTMFAPKKQIIKLWTIILLTAVPITFVGVFMALWFSERSVVLYKIGSYLLTAGYITDLILFFFVLKKFIDTLLKFVISRQKSRIGDNFFESSQQHTKTKSSNEMDTPEINVTPKASVVMTSGKLQSFDLDSTPVHAHSNEIPSFGTKLEYGSSSQVNLKIKPSSPKNRIKKMKMDKSNKKLVKLATKYCTLGLMVFISTFFGIITSGIQAKIKTYFITNLVNFVVFFDGYINFICLHLQYQFSQKSYKILCLIPHSCFLKLLRCFVGNKISTHITWNEIDSKTENSTKMSSHHTNDLSIVTNGSIHE